MTMRLTQGEHFDLIVVGAGIVGLAHAWVGASRGLSVCVVERDAACVGASIRNFGFITVTGQGEGDTWRRAMRSRDVWSELAPQAGIAIEHRGLYLVARRPEAEAVLEAFMKTAMAERCALHRASDVAASLPAFKLDDARAVLHSPHELRVESRTAIPKLSAWLEQALGVVFRWSEPVLDVEAPRVRTARGTLHADRIVVCAGIDHAALASGRFDKHALTPCLLQMLRVQPEAGFRLPGAVMSDLSLVRYLGYAALPEAAALKRAFEDEGGDAAACLAHGIHLIAVQSEDGTLVVGDSHRYEAAPEPFADEVVDALILRELHATLELEQAQVTQRWVGLYPSSASETCLIEAPNEATRLVVVSSGTGASTAFGIAEDVFAAW
jgi:FAD dependent oxidoreductase TIGR03364